MSEKVLITGGAGYIGSHTAWAFLDRGYRVSVLDNLSTGFRRCVPPAVRFVRADLADAAAVREILAAERPAGVIHFAGSTVVPESVAEPARYYANNTANSLALFNACAEAGVGTVIFSSTAAVYGITGAAPVAESAPTAPISPYGWSKLFSERMLQDIADARGFSAGILRYFNVAGADAQLRTGQLTRGATHLIKVAVEVAVGARLAIEVFGDDYDTPDGTCVRDFIHVSDLADAHVLAYERLRASGGRLVLNCGYGRGYSVRQVLDAVTALAGPIAVRPGPKRPGDAPSVVADTAALSAALPWAPRYTGLPDIVATALAWERAQLARGARIAERA